MWSHHSAKIKYVNDKLKHVPKKNVNVQKKNWHKRKVFHYTAFSMKHLTNMEFKNDQMDFYFLVFCKRIF